jgi:molecular chaperone DnaK
MNESTPAASAGNQPPVGIDLGTTYSLIAFLDTSGRPTTVPNSWGDLLTPSAVFCDDDAIVVGKEAVKNAVIAPDRFAECFKRDMGGMTFRHKMRDLPVPPEILSAFILERLKQDTEQRLGPIRQAVITVPAFFDEIRRKATQDAGRLAGLEVLDIINEPTAAALAYGYQCGLLDPQSENDGLKGTVPFSLTRKSGQSPKKPQQVLVYDLGGGTFDVTILRIEGSMFRALATDGDVLLGGKDFDERLVNHIAERFLAVHGVDPRSDQQDATQLWLDAQEAKHSLSERTKTVVPCIHAGIRMRIEVTRDEFQDLTRDLLDRTEMTASLVVQQAGLDWDRIDRILLVGGSSRMPMVREMLRRISGKEPDCSQSPDEAVAHGAAIYAGMLMKQGTAANKLNCELVNVSSHSLGLVGIHKQTNEKNNVVIIPKNTALPCRVVRNFRTARDNQPCVCISVVEGESHRPEDCISLGECVVRDLPSGLPQGTPVEVEYAYAANGRISVSARLPNVRQSARVEIRRDQASHLENLDAWRGKLLGQAAENEKTITSRAEAVDMNDPKSMLKRLDALYIKLGKAAAGITLPPALANSQKTARQAAADCTKIRTHLKDAESARQTAVGRTEAIRLDALLAQARTGLNEAQTRADFASLVLGRECACAGCLPPKMENELREIQKLQKHTAAVKERADA